MKAVKDQLVLMTGFVSDVVMRKYTDYDVIKLILIVGALIYLVTLVDIVPDWLPLGLVDDSTILMWVVKETQEEMDKYLLWKG